MKRDNAIDEFIAPELLRDNATGTVTEETRKTYTETEMNQKRRDFYDTYNLKRTREEAITKVKLIMTTDMDNEHIVQALDEISLIDYGYQGIKSLDAEFKRLGAIIKHGYEIVEQKLYLFPYHEIGVMAMYDQEGNYIYHRNMSQAERQLNVFTKVKSING